MRTKKLILKHLPSTPPFFPGSTSLVIFFTSSTPMAQGNRAHMLFLLIPPQLQCLMHLLPPFLMALSPTYSHSSLPWLQLLLCIPPRGAATIAEQLSLGNGGSILELDGTGFHQTRGKLLVPSHRSHPYNPSTIILPCKPKIKHYKEYYETKDPRQHEVDGNIYFADM